MKEKIDAIRELLVEAKSENEYGGSEDAEGCLHPGDVDWDVLQDRIIAVLEDREYIAPEPEPAPPTIWDEYRDFTWVSLNSLPLDEE